MADEELDDGHRVPTLEIWGSALNDKTGHATLFLVTTEAREVGGELTSVDDMLERTEFAVVLSHELVHFAQNVLKQAHAEMLVWELERAARAKLN